jgi:hypothetical protein
MRPGETFCRGHVPAAEDGDIRMALTSTTDHAPSEVTVKFTAGMACQAEGITIFQPSVNDVQSPSADLHIGDLQQDHGEGVHDGVGPKSMKGSRHARCSIQASPSPKTSSIPEVHTRQSGRNMWIRAMMAIAVTSGWSRNSAPQWLPRICSLGCGCSCEWA